MGVVAVAIVVVCAALYTAFELIERRKRRNFEEQLRQYIKEHKGDWDNGGAPHRADQENGHAF